MKPKVIFGLRDFPRPYGYGFFYGKLYPNYREALLISFDLYDTESPELKNVLTEGINTLLQQDLFKENLTIDELFNYDTENMREWSRDILDNVIKSLPQNHKP